MALKFFGLEATHLLCSRFLGQSKSHGHARLQGSVCLGGEERTCLLPTSGQLVTLQPHGRPWLALDVASIPRPLFLHGSPSVLLDDTGPGEKCGGTGAQAVGTLCDPRGLPHAQRSPGAL